MNLKIAVGSVHTIPFAISWAVLSVAQSERLIGVLKTVSNGLCRCSIVGVTSKMLLRFDCPHQSVSYLLLSIEEGRDRGHRLFRQTPNLLPVDGDDGVKEEEEEEAAEE